MNPIYPGLLAALFITPLGASVREATPYLGSWAFALPDGRPVWLKLERNGGELSGSLLWSVGSAKPVKNLRFHNGALRFERAVKWKPHGGAVVRQVRAPFTVRCLGRSLHLTARHAPFVEGGKTGAASVEPEPLVLIGKKMPPLPPRPDLVNVVFGDSIDLLENGLEDWRLEDPRKKNGWRMEGGVLINDTPKTDFSAYGEYGNLRTVADFEDFKLTIEYNVDAGGNSGIYLRGAYEAQVVDRDSRMQGIQGPGAIFGRIAPSENAGNPGGEWNRYVLTLVDRHITVVLNGKTVIDNQPLEGCTGGGISADDTRPGPIFLQGDHTPVKYRNIKLRPVVAR